MLRYLLHKLYSASWIRKRLQWWIWCTGRSTRWLCSWSTSSSRKWSRTQWRSSISAHTTRKSGKWSETNLGKLWPNLCHGERKKNARKYQFIDDSRVIPYIPFLLLKYGCHINIEYVFGQKACKYIFKYLLKGIPQNCLFFFICLCGV